MSLYETLGGRPAVELVVAAFYERVLADPLLRPFFRGVQMSRLMQHQVDFFAQALGGPQAYTGRSMLEAHAGLPITDAHFDAVARHLADALRSADVAPPHIATVLELVGGLRGQIVTVRTSVSASR